MATFVSQFRNNVLPLLNPVGRVGRLSMGHGMADLYASFLFPILPILAVHLHFNLAVVSLLSFLISLTSSILQPFYGWLVDRFPRFNWILLGLALSSIGISFIGFVPNVWVLAAVITVGYMGVGLFHPPATSLANQVSQKLQSHDGMAMSIFMAGGNIGFSLGPLVSVALVHFWGLESIIWMLLPAVLLLPLFTNLKQNTALITSPESQEVSPSSQQWTGLERRLLFRLALINTMRAMVIIGLPTLMPFLWKDQISPLWVGVLISLSSFIGGPLSLLIVPIANRFGYATVLLVSFLPTLLLPLLPILSGFPQFSAFVFIIGILESTIALNVHWALKVIEHKQNQAAGIVGGLSFGIGGLLVSVLSYIAHLWGLPLALSLMVFPMLGAMAMVIYLGWFSPRKHLRTLGSI